MQCRKDAVSTNRARGEMESPLVHEFVDILEPINTLAESWFCMVTIRLKW
ncbi:hypothetical protein SVI_1299 [Shewanella violacea DSS12]|uniref:Uncharacterized protein n=1 Tax=Shewanella violacea (strain JCM 10179 / CIP 106290 / LMG 19151 / DSS12) TaxID=637905 RepID=D4ZHX1_SHEVD|nr:hypothetical protein SVI_1299 [Shewanella violacea DSS12]